MHQAHHRIVITTKNVLVLLLFAGALAFSFSSYSVAAQEATPSAESRSDLGPQFVIYPAGANDGDYFSLQADAGTTNELVVILGNADAEVLTLSTYVANAIPSANGGFLLAQKDEPLHGTATWIDYETATLELQPGKGIERSFEITIPEGTAPGQYIAGLVLQTAEPLPVAGSTQYTQVIRKPIAVFITVPGDEMPEFSLGEPAIITNAATGSIVVPVVNSGNVLVRPAGEVSLVDSTGQTVFEAPIELSSVYAGFTVPMYIPISPSVPDGEYTMFLSLTDEATGAVASIEGEGILLSSETEVPDQFGIAADIVAQPDADDPVFLNVSVTASNNGEDVSSSEIVLDVMRNGELHESFTLASSFALPTGETEVTQRYIPPAGFEPGEWTFVIRLNVVDPSTGSATTVATLDDIPPIVVP